MRASALAALAYLLLLPNYTEFRLELVLVPMAATGLATAADALLAVGARPLARVGLGTVGRDADAPLTREQEYVGDGARAGTGDRTRA
jgi:hypothetical protein